VAEWFAPDYDVEKIYGKKEKTVNLSDFIVL